MPSARSIFWEFLSPHTTPHTIRFGKMQKIRPTAMLWYTSSKYLTIWVLVGFVIIAWPVIVRPAKTNDGQQGRIKRAIDPTENTIGSEHIRTSNTSVGEAISIVVMSDRGPGSSGPLRGLVNSLLRHTVLQHDMVFHYISNHPYTWLDNLHTPSHFDVYRHESTPLLSRVLNLVKVTDFYTTHYSGKFAMMKLYVAALDFPERPRSILLVDDDMVFYRSVDTLWLDVVLPTSKPLSLHCPTDPIRIKKYSKRPKNAHPERYCITGLMGFKLENEIGDDNGRMQQQQYLFQMMEDSAQAIMTDYPTFLSGVADQDVVNRLFADNPDIVQLIPCEWQCDRNSCRKAKNNFTSCTNCPTAVECFGFHFLAKSYKKHVPLGKANLAWNHYATMNSTRLVEDVVAQRRQQQHQH